ncbi:MAG: lipoprotein [Candidatus Diapherotrites archaeon]|nr:lipoprotein [Candidatus Diapherotrites archaeon]
MKKIARIILLAGLVFFLSGCSQPMTCEQYADYVQQEIGKLDKTCSTAQDCGMGLSYMCRPFCVNKDVNMLEFHSSLPVKMPGLCPLYECKKPEMECTCQNNACMLVPSEGKECETDADCPENSVSQCLSHCDNGKCIEESCDAIGRKCQANAECIGKHSECPKTDCTEPEIACENGVCSCTCPKPQIKTDKTEYAQGETIRAEVEASADGREYFYDSTRYPSSSDGNNPKIWIEMLENGRWARVLKGCALTCGDIDCNTGWPVPCEELGPPGCSKLGKYSWNWDMKTCDKVNGKADGNACQYIEEYGAKPGTYRLSLYISASSSCNEGMTAHSNEFTIRQA